MIWTSSTHPESYWPTLPQYKSFIKLICISTLFYAYASQTHALEDEVTSKAQQSVTQNTDNKQAYLHSAASSNNTSASIAFYYNKVEHVSDLINFDRVVLSPSLVSEQQVKALQKAGTSVFAYLSVGEFGTQKIPNVLAEAVLLENKDWQSKVMNLASKEWKDYIYTEASTLLEKGFDGIFLDTLDSYQLASKDVSNNTKQQKHLIEIINRLYNIPLEDAVKTKLILNRGFDIVPKLDIKPYAVVAESMYKGFSPIEAQYNSVSANDSQWLKNKLDVIKGKEIEIIVIDYVPTEDREQQVKAAKKLISHGYTPYVSDGLLYDIGISTVRPVFRRILGFYNSSRDSLRVSPCHAALSMVIEYFGYIPECHDINTFDFENTNLNNYAAVTFWLSSDDYVQFSGLERLIARGFNKLPMLFLNGFPEAAAINQLLNIEYVGDLSPPLQQSQGHSLTDDFKQPVFPIFESSKKFIATSEDVSSEVVFNDDNGEDTAYVYTAKWGGAAISPYPMRILANGDTVWLVDPFALLSKTLKLPVIPALDMTTESSRRILLSYVDGDGFATKSLMPGRPYVSEVMRDEIFKPYKLPHTVSVIQGEIYSGGIYGEQSEALENVARSIFNIPHVEPASHTYSHPFFWRDTDVEARYGLHLPIDGYQLDFNKEIYGSLDYINTVLVPEDKKAELILWTGQANPSKDILEMTQSKGIGNINGGNTFVVNGNMDYTQVYPTIVWYPSAVQVYAPVINENLYTNLWTEHYDGFARAIETFELLETPRRLKPISIYYHMYSGEFPASLEALTSVYDWAMSQSTNPMYLSEFVDRAMTFYDTGIAKTLDGHWQVSASVIRSIRIPNELGYPSTEQVVGYKQEPDGIYATLPSKKSIFTTFPSAQDSTYLHSSNSQIKYWEVKSNEVNWSVLSHVPLELDIHLKSDISANSCKVKANKAVSLSIEKPNLIVIKSKHTGRLTGTLNCVSKQHVDISL